MIWLLVVLIAIIALYLLAIRGRRNKSVREKLGGSFYAHRGLHGNGIPENSMAAFRAALEKGYGIELDVHLCRDGSLPVFHDGTLSRTTGAEGKLCDLTAREWEQLTLEGTQESIPHFRQVLELYAGKQPMIIELKADGNNHSALCTAVCAALEGYEGVYCLESFDPRCIAWLRKNRPDLIRGQLSENFFRSKTNMPGILRFALSFLVTNAITRPDFVAYRYSDRNHIAVRLCRKLWGIPGVSWTIRTQEECDTALREGWIPIFEYFEP